MKRNQLSKPQAEFLFEIASGPKAVSDTWKPALKLIELGYARGLRGKLGGFRVEITSEGRKYVSETEA